MELDHIPFWNIERACPANDVTSVQKVKFKTTNHDETAQEYTVSKDDGERGAEWTVRLTQMFYMIAAEQCNIVGPTRFVSFLNRICAMVGDIQPPRIYHISTAMYLKYITLMLHSTLYVRILIWQLYKAVIPIESWWSCPIQPETTHGHPLLIFRPYIAAGGAWAPPMLRVR